MPTSINFFLEPAFLNVLAPCPRGWGYNTEDLMQINKLAADTCYWPLYEVVDGVYHVTYKPPKKLPIDVPTIAELDRRVEEKKKEKDNQIK